MTLLATVRRVFRTIRAKNVPFEAASIAYYATASFVPLVVLTLAVLSTFGAGDLLVAVLHSTLSRSRSEVLESVLENTRGREIAGAIGVALTGWSGSRVFRGLTLAFEEVHEDGAERSLFDRVEKSFVVVAVLLLAFVFLAAGTAFWGRCCCSSRSSTSGRTSSSSVPSSMRRSTGERAPRPGSSGERWQNRRVLTAPRIGLSGASVEVAQVREATLDRRVVGGRSGR